MDFKQDIRSLIKEENELFDRRKGHFGVLQGLLWVSLGLVLSADPGNDMFGEPGSDDHRKIFLGVATIIPLMGMVAAFDSGLRMENSRIALERVLKYAKEKTTLNEQQILIGLNGHSGITKSFEGLSSYLLLLSEFPVVPITFISGWTTILALLWFLDESVHKGYFLWIIFGEILVLCLLGYNRFHPRPKAE